MHQAHTQKRTPKPEVLVLVRTAHRNVLMTVHGCDTQYSTEQF